MPPPDALPWTTSRCHRLLRPISTRVAALRKEIANQRRLADGAAKIAALALRATNSSQSSRARKPRSFDDDWVPGAKPPGGGTQTYARRKAHRLGTARRGVEQLGTSTRPGEIPFTPFIARAGTERIEESRVHDYDSSPYKLGKQDAETNHNRDLKKNIRGEIGKQTHGIICAYENLLRTSRSSDSTRRKGARSLMRTCLRNMPEYIELQEYFAELDKEEADEDEDCPRDICDETYIDLEETFGTATGQGWRHLKEIVRAHGTSLICHAFGDNVLGIDALFDAVHLCIDQGAYDEAEKLFWSFLPRLKPCPMPVSLQGRSLFDQEPYMRLAGDFVRRTRRHGFLYHLLERMISDELLPLEWLATECMRPVWNRLVRTLSGGDIPDNSEFVSALCLLKSAINAGIGLPDDNVFRADDDDVILRQLKPSARRELRDALDSTYSSLFTILASITLVSQNPSLIWVLDYIVIGLLRRKGIRENLELLDTTTENMQTFAQRALLVVATSSLVRLGHYSIGSQEVSVDITTSIKAFSWVSYQYSSHEIDISSILATLPGFISSTACCVGKAKKEDGLDQLHIFVTSLLSLRGHRLPHKLWNLARLALETCTEFAQKTKESRHFAYARKVERLVNAKGRVVLVQSPQKADSPSAQGGLRWEEGIGEWVTCTPFAKQGVQRPRTRIRPLKLLPTPEPSDSSSLSIDAGSDEDEEFSTETAQPCSSPIKEARNELRVSLGKRTRACSPMVVIAVKRLRHTPLSFDEHSASLPSPESDVCKSSSPGPRRSRRAGTHTSYNVEIQGTLRTRSSLDNSLRSLTAEKYADVERNQTSCAAKNPPTKRTRSSLDCSMRYVDAKTFAVDNTNAEMRSDKNRHFTGDDDSSDELANTPATLKAQWKSNTTIEKSGPRRARGTPLRKRRSHEGDLLESEASEDELSFI